MSQNDYEVMQEAVDMLRQLEDFEQFSEMSDVISRLQDKLAVTKHNRKPIVHFDSVPHLKGLRLLNPLYNYIAHKQTLRITYQSFSARQPQEFILYPYLLKEFRNRWFLFGCQAKDMKLYSLPPSTSGPIIPVQRRTAPRPLFLLFFTKIRNKFLFVPKYLLNLQRNWFPGGVR